MFSLTLKEQDPRSHWPYRKGTTLTLTLQEKDQCSHWPYRKRNNVNIDLTGKGTTLTLTLQEQDQRSNWLTWTWLTIPLTLTWPTFPLTLTWPTFPLTLHWHEHVITTRTCTGPTLFRIGKETQEDCEENKTWISRQLQMWCYYRFGLGVNERSG